MTDSAIAEVIRLREVVADLVAAQSPFICPDEMQRRYGVTGQTLLAMERRQEIPQRVRGRWLRAEVMTWERM